MGNTAVIVGTEEDTFRNLVVEVLGYRLETRAFHKIIAVIGHTSTDIAIAYRTIAATSFAGTEEESSQALLDRIKYLMAVGD